jgi:phosphopantothenoylcysteine synthetase/decarboxylase
VVAPATANIIGKIANGICDDLLSTVLCTCWAKPALLAPAMNSNMWNNPAVQRNVKTAKEMGFELIGPEEGRLACGAEGIGRMSEPQDIIKAIERITSKLKKARSTKS